MDLLKSLQTINDNVVRGILDDNSLIKANIAYKEKTNFSENTDYNINKSFTLNQFIKTGKPNQELMKALVLGDTKVGSDGKTYIVVQIPSGKLDWRVLKTPNNSNNDLNDSFDNDDFPKSQKDVTFIKNLGGSTGAFLVEDSNNNKFVVKEGNSVEHVKEEFLSNALYRAMGFDTPDMKLYEENGKTFILSRFVENTTPFDSALNKNDKLAMKAASEGFVADCLMANWDSFQNDNILIDSNGVPIRVDNGGSLRYRAQGALKTNFSSTVGELVTMINNNQWLGDYLTQDDINAQIEDIVKNEKNILGLIEDKGLKGLMKARIVYLKNRLPNKAKKGAKKAANKEMYRDITDAELDEAYDSVNGNLYHQTNDEGWKFLSEICKLRGFDGVPEVLDDAEFDTLLADNENIYTNRGLDSSGSLTARQCMESYATGEVCYYGRTGVHGQGIYSAVNKLRKRDKSDPGFYTATTYYGGNNPNNVLDIIIPKTAKTITKKEARDLMQEEFFGPEFKTKKAEFDTAEKAYLTTLKNLDKEKDEIEAEVKKELGWDEKILDYLVFQRPEELLADTKKNPKQTVLNTFEKIVLDLNGNWDRVDETNYEVKLPNSSKKFIFNSHDLDNALKQRNASSPVYNYRMERLKNFIMENHFNKIKDNIQSEIKDSMKNNPKMLALEAKIKTEKGELDKIEAEVNHLRKNGSSTSNKVVGKILKTGSDEMYGIFAALKGYDVLIAEGGNGDCDYNVILNRSITKVRKF